MEDDEEETTASTLRGKPRPPPVSAQSAFSYIPPRRLDPKEHSYYYRQARVRTAGGHGGGKAGRLGRGERPAAEGWGRGDHPSGRVLGQGSPSGRGRGGGAHLRDWAWGAGLDLREGGLGAGLTLGTGAWGRGSP